MPDAETEAMRDFGRGREQAKRAERPPKRGLRRAVGVGMASEANPQAIS